MFPGLAVAEVLRGQGHEVLLFVSEKDVDARALRGHPDLPSKKLPSIGLPSIFSPAMVTFLRRLRDSWKKCGVSYDTDRPHAVLGMGGLTHGGLNFDAKRRRESHTPEDLFHAHIGGMDTFARGLKIAAALRADGRIVDFVKKRYGTWDSELGRKIERGQASLADLDKLAMSQPAPVLSSGGQEYLENIVNEFL